MKPMTMSNSDWTTGHPLLRYQQCAVCHQRWYFERPFCPGCGNHSPESYSASGLGTVYALTTVERSPGDTWQALVPYTIVLVDADEGFRAMGHAEPGVAIGDRVKVSFTTHGGKMLPRFAPTFPLIPQETK